MDLSKTKKTMYQVRYSVGSVGSMRVASYDTKAKAVKRATRDSKRDNNRLYYVKQITTEIVFSIGKA